MDQLSIIALLYRLGAFSERLSWWAFDRSSRMREEYIHRMALDKMRVAGPGYGFARTIPLHAETNATQPEFAPAVPTEVAQPQPVRTAAPAAATGRIAAEPTPIRPAALSKAAEPQDDEQDSTVKPRRTALG